MIAYEEDEYQCARCGSTMAWEDCGTCSAVAGLDRYGFGDPDCPTCNGEGRMGVCLSSRGWCEENPLPGREDVARHTIEHFTIPLPGAASGGS